MSVAVKTYSFENKIYGGTSFLGVKNGDNQQDDFEYRGFMNGISPYLIPLSEWNNLTATSTSYTIVAGDMTGFDSTAFRTKLHTISTDGENYSLGLAVQRFAEKRYAIIFYGWSISFEEWHAYNYIDLIGTNDETLSEIYVKQPQYIYLDVLSNTNLVRGGYHWYDIKTLKFYWREDQVFRYVIYPYLTIENEAPDPRPDPEGLDPYYPGGESGTGGGTGDFDDQSDPVTIPALPQVSAVNTGFITIFNPTISEMLSLSTYMWSNPLFDVSAWKKIFADPMQAILGLSIVPVAVPDGGRKIVTVGNIPTGIEMTTASSQYVIVDCGSLNVNEFWGAYLDYDPYTKAEIYLPYIGTHALAVDDIMGKTVSVVYHIDILSGACCAYVKCGDSVLYSFTGQCASSIPITGDNWTNVINGALSIAGSIGSMVATGGMSAPMEIGNIASTAVNSMKPSIEKSGSMGGTGGLLGVQTPYLILTRPRQALPKDQNVFKGYPSFITVTLRDLSGYTEVETVHLEDIPATDAEIMEIENILKTGVIF